LRVQAEIGNRSARVRVIPVCEDDLKDVWMFDQYRRDADELKAAESAAAGKAGVPRLRVLGSEEG
jgi:hypothetical protein